MAQNVGVLSGLTRVRSARLNSDASLRESVEKGVVRKWEEWECLPPPLGEGSYAVVWRMRRKHTQPFAVKVLHGAVDAGRLQEITHEFSILRALSEEWLPEHPWDAEECPPIVKVRGLFLEPRLGLVLELYGISLSDALQLQPKGSPAPPDEPERVTVARDVASGLSFLHSRMVAHRDLKASNVLVAPGNGYKAKLTDFGTSHLLDALTANHVQRGTPAYWAPELLHAVGGSAEEAAALDYPRVDTYAFGVLLCELWAEGASPFRDMPRPYDNEECDLMAAVCNAGWRPSVPAGMPEEYAALMQSCWHAEPAERPTFEMVCDTLAALRAASAAVPVRTRSSLGGPEWPLEAAATAARTATTRVQLLLSYKPSVPRGTACQLTAQFLPESSEQEALIGPAASLSDDGTLNVALGMHVAVGDTCELKLHPQDGCASWLGAAKAHIELGKTVVLVIRPKWEQAPRLPACGVAAALRVDVERTAVAEPGSRRKPFPVLRVLGSVSLLLAKHEAPRARGAWPSAERVCCLSRMPNLLRLGAPKADIFISYRDTETGMRSNNGYAFSVQSELEAAGYSVFCYATLIREGNAWVNVLQHGLDACAAFVPICSPEYGDLDISPWTHNEVLYGTRRRRQLGAPAIVPLWHHGSYPPADTVGLLTPDLPRVPAGGSPARDLDFGEVMKELLLALENAGVKGGKCVVV